MLTSIEELRASAVAWDDLWQRSTVDSPLLQAEPVAQWVEQFCPEATFRAVVVDDGHRWLAALPLIETRVGRVLSAGGLTSNPWASCGDLLCDPTSDVPLVMERLVCGLRRLPWQLLWLNDAPCQAPQWQALLAACGRVGVDSSCHERFSVGRLAIEGTWATYQKRLSKSHRQSMNRAARRLAEEGDVQFELLAPTDSATIEPWLREAFAVEDASWKGREGSSILQTPGMTEFFVGQAQSLASRGHLRLASLRFNGRMLAFVYGFCAKQTFFAHKIGYDPEFNKSSPGQLLFFQLLERFHTDSQVKSLDFVGPLTEGLSRWRPDGYPIGRIVIAPRRLLGRAALFAYKNLWRRFRKEPAVAAPATEAD